MKKCFVVMPFRPPFKGYYNDIFKPAIKKCGYEVINAEEMFGPRPIMSDVLEGINDATIVVVDISTLSPNVNYELGIAHAIGKPTILLCQHNTEIPFDYKEIRTIFYDTTDSKWQTKLSKAIQTSIKSIETSPEKFIINSHYRIQENILRQRDNLAMDFLRNTWRHFEGVIEYEYDYSFDSSGVCTMIEKWNITAITNISHVYTTVFSKTPGIIKVESVKNNISGNDLEFLYDEPERNAKRLPFFILLNYNLHPGTRTELLVHAKCENSLPGLFSNNSDTEVNVTTGRSRVKHYHNMMKYSFPNTDKFKNIHGMLTLKNNGVDMKTVALEKDLTTDFIVLSYNIKLNHPDKYDGFDVLFTR